MKLSHVSSVLLILVAFFLGLMAAHAADAQEATDGKSDNATYLLRYKLSQGERLQTRVVQMAKVTTKIDRREEIVQTHSDSIKQWKVIDVNDAGEMTFEHAVLTVSMSQTTEVKVEGGDPPYEKSSVGFHSDDSTEEIPEMYIPVAKSVKKILATVTINGQGQVVNRDDHTRQYNPGWGDLLLPLPEKAVSVGYQWASPREIPVKLQDKTFKQIKTRQLYTLLSVKHGVATIRSKTQLLSPVTDPRVQSQLVQQFSDGEIKFDLDAGYVIGKQIDLDEDIVGFSGAGSRMIYVARLTEKLVPKAEMIPDTSEKILPKDVDVAGADPGPPEPTYGPSEDSAADVAEQPDGSTIK
jgi:hypothetical protein